MTILLFYWSACPKVGWMPSSCWYGICSQAVVAVPLAGGMEVKRVRLETVAIVCCCTWYLGF
jgi:hypothetical protein